MSKTWKYNPTLETDELGLITNDDLDPNFVFENNSGDLLEIIEINEFVDYDSSFRYDSANKEYIYVKPLDDVSNYRIYLENNVAFPKGKKVTVFWHGATDEIAKLEVAKRNLDDNWQVESIYKKCVKGYIWDGAHWLAQDNRLIDFGALGSIDFASPARAVGLNAIAVGSNAVANSGVSMGANSLTYTDEDVAIGHSAVADTKSVAVGNGSSAVDESVAMGDKTKGNGGLNFVNGGHESELDRHGEEGRNLSKIDNTHHYRGRISWAGIIDKAPGNWEIFLQKNTNKRFTTTDNSSILGIFKLTMTRIAGGGEMYSTVRSLTVKRGGGANTVTIKDNTVLSLVNDSPSYMSFTLVANTTTGNLEVWCSGGATVQAYDLLITAEFDYIETII